MKEDEVSKELHGPIMELTMQDLVNGVPKYGHDFQEYICQEIMNVCKKTNKDPAEYRVLEIDGKFCVYYLVFVD